MSRGLITERASRAQASGGLWATLGVRAARLLGAMALGALLLALTYQIPVVHTVDIGGYDAAYVQGFYDPERSDAPGERPYLAGSDGSARWTPGVAYLLFPQAGAPAQVTLRLRGWRASGPPPDVRVLLNGARELASFRASGDWEERSFVIDDGLLKPNDVVIEIRSTTAQIQPDDPRRVGVLLDSATYRAGPAPLAPYPAQLAYGALAAGMLYLLLDQRRPPGRIARISSLARRPEALWAIGVLLIGALFLTLYRAQPPYPYPLRGLLPAIDAALAGLLALRHGPALARRAPALLDALALGGIGAWTAALLLAARGHVTLATPGVEKDFRVFAIRSADLGGVFQADGFYNLGYPLLLWLARPLSQDNPFLAARLIAALSAALLLGAAWWLARRWMGRAPALLALAALALSPLVVAYALYLGSDMPFAALCTLAIALLLAPLARGQGSGVRGQGSAVDSQQSAVGSQQSAVGSQQSAVSSQQSTVSSRQLAVSRQQAAVSSRQSAVGRQESLEAFAEPRALTPGPWRVIGAGLAAGLAFLMRHPGILLLPFGWLALLYAAPAARPPLAWRAVAGRLRAARTSLLIFTLAFGLAILPQLAVNLAQTGQPFYNQQAKNIWLAVFGDSDWGRWGEASNMITLGQIVRQDPARFLANWWANVRGYVGAGGEDTSEFGHAIQLRLLGFPANWLAIGGLLAWLIMCLRRVWSSPADSEEAAPSSGEPRAGPMAPLLAWIAVYVLAISVGFALPRFYLPLAPIYAIAAAWIVARAFAPPAPVARLAAALLLIVFLWGGFSIGAASVLGSQPADEVAAVQLVQATLRPGERLVVRVPARVSLGKYSAIAHLALPAPSSDDPAALRATGAAYLLWSSEVGPDPASGAPIGSAGPYTLYRIGP